MKKQFSIYIIIFDSCYNIYNNVIQAYTYKEYKHYASLYSTLGMLHAALKKMLYDL